MEQKRPHPSKNVHVILRLNENPSGIVQYFTTLMVLKLKQGGQAMFSKSRSCKRKTPTGLAGLVVKIIRHSILAFADPL